MRRIALFVLLPLALLILTACAPWEDAVSFVEELRNPESVSGEPESEPEEVSVLPDDSEVRKTLGIVVSGKFPFSDECILRSRRRYVKILSLQRCIILRTEKELNF